MFKIYVDIRCLQDSNYVYRGIGYHTISILKLKSKFMDFDFQMVGLLDPTMQEMPEEYKKYFDSLEYSCGEIDHYNSSIFIQPSPMTHDITRYGKFLNRKKVISACIIYDFIPIRFETETYLPTFQHNLSYVNSLIWTKQYDLFFPISEYTNLELVNILGISNDKRYVTGVALRSSFKKKSNDVILKEEFGLESRKYFIVVAGADPRKNIEIVLRAQCELLLNKQIEIGLIVLGGYSERQCEEFSSTFIRSGGKKNKLLFLKNITDEELAFLYQGAIAAIAPSKIEGFSIPIIEAISCGCPVLASNCNAHLELVQQTKNLFHFENLNELVFLMEGICKDPLKREKLLKQQKKVPLNYTEKKVAERFWKPILKEFKKRKQQIRGLSSKPKIAFVTPYPPDQSGVALYSKECFIGLSKYACLDVFTDAKNIISDPNVNSFHPISAYPYVSAKYDRIISVVGNSRYHNKIIDNQRLYGGPCISHDNRLTELYYSRLGEQKFLEKAEATLGFPVSINEVYNWMQNPNKLPLLFFDDVISLSQPFIVHSKLIQNQIQKIYGCDAKYLPLSILNQFTEHELSYAMRLKVRKELGIPEERIVIVTLGIMHEVKAPNKCILAVDLLRQYGMNAHLYFVGTSGSLFLDKEKKLINKLGLQNYIHSTGDDWISDTEYKNYIIAADFSIQLRIGPIGQVSAALQDCISGGLPVVASKDLAQSIEAEDIVHVVSDNLCPIEIAKKLHEAYQAGEHLTRITNKRKRYLEIHSVENYAFEFMKILNLS